MNYMADYGRMVFRAFNREEWLEALEKARPGDEIHIIRSFDMTNSPIKGGVIYYDAVRGGAKYRFPLPEEIPPLNWIEGSRYDREHNETIFRITGQRKSMFFSEVEPGEEQDGGVIASKNRLIAGMTSAIAEKDRQITSLESKLKEKEADIKRALHLARSFEGILKGWYAA
jgi:hypothetical protein